MGSGRPALSVWGTALLLMLPGGLAACGDDTPTPQPTGSPAATGAATGSPSASASPTPTASPSRPPSTDPTPPSTPSVTPRPTPKPTESTPAAPASPACSLPEGLLGRDLTTLPTSRKVVALTFDAGASNEGVAPILRTLADRDVPATFFMTGEFADDFPSSARAMARYPVGNHTYSHPDLTTLSDSRIRTEIASAEARIAAVTGQDPRPYFRFPFGAVSERTVSLVNSRCYVPFRWTVDTLGWKGTSEGQSVDTVVSRVLAGARAGEIVLMHVGAHPKDGSTLDADALPTVIDELRERGYGFVTVAAVLGPEP